MMYQLPNGKVVHLTIEEYLALTDEDIQYFMSKDFGDHVANPFTQSAVKKNSKEKSYDFSFIPEEDKDINDDDSGLDNIIDIMDFPDM